MKLTFEGKSIFDCTYEELQTANELFGRAWSIMQQKATTNFSIGDRVSFHGRGTVIMGTVKKVNQKTVSVKSDQGTTWKVSGSLLTKLK